MEKQVEDWKTLLRRAQGEDLTAYGRIVERFQDMAVGYGYAILRDMFLAQDAAQEAFLEAYNRLSTLHAPEAFPGLLRKIVFKHCDRLTRRGKGYQIVSIDAALDRISPEPAPDLSLEAKEMQEMIHEAIEALPEEERIAVTMFYISDHSQKDIAAFLDLPVMTVKNRLRTARKRLKERLWIMVEQNLHDARPSKDDLFLNKVMRVIAPDEKKDAEAIYNLYEHTLHWPDMARWLRRGRIADSHYDWATSRIGFADDDLMAHIGVYEINLRLGTALVRLAGINVDNVDPDYETGRPLFDKTVEETLQAMYAHGYDLSVVRNTPLSRYAPHGYVSALERWTTYRINTEHLPAEPSNFRIQKIDHDDIFLYPGVAEIYNRENENVPMTAVRPTYPHGKCPHDAAEWGQACLFVDEAGQLVGYYADSMSSEAGKEQEWIGVSDSAGDPEQRLRVFGELARKQGYKGVEFFNLPYLSDMARHLRRYEYTYTSENGPSHSPMRIINLESTLSKMAGELSRRLKAAGHGGWSGSLRFAVDDQTAVVKVEKGACSVSSAGKTSHSVEGGQEMVRLFVGTDTPEEVVAEAGIQLSGDAEWLIRALFPPQRPALPNEYL